MKKIIFLFSLVLTGFVMLANSNITPPNHYNTEWNKVDSLKKIGLPKSALEWVNKIYQEAGAEGNDPELVKAIIYKSNLTAEIEEEGNIKKIELLKSEIKIAKTPVRQILHSILAETYWNFYQQNRWQLMNRSITVNFEQNDIKTWDVKKITEEVISQYLQSLQLTDILKTIDLKDFDSILVLEKNSKKYRPTLYDFLAHRAIDFFKNDEARITEPLNKFVLDDEKYFLSSDEFSHIALTTEDSLSLKFYAINILKDLIAFHLKDKDTAALIDVDLERLSFVKSNSILPNKDSLYLGSLTFLEKNYYDNPASIDVIVKMAEFYHQQSNLYKPLISDQHKWDNKKAYELCEDAIKRFPKGNTHNCNYFLEQISTIDLNFKTESVNVPDQPFRALVTYKNVRELFVRIIKIDYEKNNEIVRVPYDEDRLKEYLKLPVTKEFNLQLIDDGDYNQHSCEIKIPELPVGFYAVLVANNADFSIYNKNISPKKNLTYSNFWISNISYISRSDKNANNEFYVFNRETGKPIKNVKAQIYYEKYNYSKQINETLKWETFFTNYEGNFIVPSDTKEDFRNFYVDFISNDDELVTEDRFYLGGNYQDKSQPKPKTFFFTDRVIYRPGQTLYFKGIMLQRSGDESKIITYQNTTVQFFDVNYQKVSEQTLTSNEYGSFSGSFQIPSGLLNGQMSIKNESGSIYLSVEEYKRPKFEVKFNPVSGSYKLNEKVTVKGIAKTYAGSNITDAEVKYRVVRQARFPYHYWWFVPPSSPPLEIKNGFVKTNDKGEFEITFDALPDLSIDKATQPIFNFQVFADVTDINGETHSASTNIAVGYTALIADVNIPGELDKDLKNEFTIKTVNLNGEPENTQGEIFIYKLKQPEKIYRERKWEMPDKFIMTKEEYEQAFPYDIYKNENDVSTWAKEKQVFNLLFDTEKSKQFSIEGMKEFQTGNYVIELKTKDKYGEPVEWKKYFTVFSPQAKQIPDYSENFFEVLKNKAEPGDSVSFLIGSREKEVKVLYEIENKNKIISKQWLNISDRQMKIKISVLEKYRGNFTIHLCFVKHNRVYNHDVTFVVPRSDKQLDITFETFRDKLQPGENEEWRIKIKGKNSDKVAAEMLATLYDASLDDFKKNAWSFNIYNSYSSRLNWNVNQINNSVRRVQEFVVIGYGTQKKSAVSSSTVSEEKVEIGAVTNLKGEDSEMLMSNESLKNFQEDKDIGGDIDLTKNKISDFSNVVIRKNFNETAFFYPQLQTDENGEVIIKFTVPEALTKWKMLGFAHTKDLKYGFTEKELVTQKDLMVMPNAPRFFRESDTLYFSAKISNVSENDLSGDVMLNFFDTENSKKIDSLMQNIQPVQTFKVSKGQSAAINWKVSVPAGIDAIKYKIVARSGNFSDGEEMIIPVLTNRMLVTESMPLPINGKQTKTFKLEKLIHSDSSKTLRNHKLTLEFTPNPAWYAVQALPYMMEYPYECSEQIFSRFYANSLASFIVNSNPKIKEVFDTWKNYSPDASLSNLEKNQELKSVMLEETPWVLNAKDESQRKQRVALLFDLNKMANELEKALQLLQKKQTSNGGWPWFDGMPESRYITQHIVTGMGQLNHIGIKKDLKTFNMVVNAVHYLDSQMSEDYKNLKKSYTDKINDNHLGSEEIQYLYARSYFKDNIFLDAKNKEAFDYFQDQAKKYWMENNKYLQGMIALALNRYGDQETPAAIIKSLKEKAIHNEEMGMYWKDMEDGYYWWQAPIETQSLLIETFDEVAGDKESVEEMKIWLLKQKQTQDWKTTKATAEACYALLLKGTDFLSKESEVEIMLGNQKIEPKKMDNVKTEAGTGYFKVSWNGSDINPEMGNVTVTKKDEGVAWGALYWQYFEQLDKITPHATPLKLEKKLFIEKNTPSGPVIEPITDNTILNVGDKIKVRIELRVNRDMEYIHMKDMRAAGFEPVNVFSGYKYQGGLGYYESTKDAATNFFISYLPKGTYVFEYPLVVNQRGDFSNGVTTIQCMYAPEFTSHSEGIRVKVK